MVKTWQKESWEHPTDGGDPGGAEEPTRPDDTEVLETKVEPQGQAAKVKSGWRKTEVELVLPRTEVKLKGRWSQRVERTCHRRRPVSPWQWQSEGEAKGTRKPGGANRPMWSDGHGDSRQSKCVDSTGLNWQTISLRWIHKALSSMASLTNAERTDISVIAFLANSEQAEEATLYLSFNKEREEFGKRAEEQQHEN
ncbi:hypothetical protein DPX16_7651 [Anabarilius grahami]|uniref:Uncharacterized protein n=1 Tax=Anabarilius grahami TaxID=495550 RepID=A0A3N0YR77_ANAGA|nr:hypothetical protein DPX16_7651 [Anabarilius grahami]